MQRFLLVTFVLYAANAVAQKHDSDPTPRVSKTYAEVQLEDGSKIRVKLLDAELTVNTKYGVLKVPTKDISKIDFGLHFLPDFEVHAAREIKNLGSTAFKDRDGAGVVLLGMGPRVYPFLLDAEKSDDLEVAKRAAGLLKTLREKYAASKLMDRKQDMLHTVGFPVQGEIQDKEFRCVSDTLGELKLKIHSIVALTAHQSLTTDLTLNADYFGTEFGTWMDAGISVTPGTTVNISAAGQVELWPQTPGQYLTGPEGHAPTAGRNGFRAGALVAKIGSGQPFVVGESISRLADASPSGVDQGRLFLAIVPSPWNQRSAGGYTVKVRVE